MTSKIRFLAIAYIISVAILFWGVNHILGLFIDLFPFDKAPNDSWFNIEPKFLFGISFLLPLAWFLQLTDNNQ